MDTYQSAMAFGHTWLDAGQYGKALVAFDRAFSLANRPTYSINALQMSGVASRLLGEFDDAVAAFDWALDVVAVHGPSGNMGRTIRANIWRDQALCLIAIAKQPLNMKVAHLVEAGRLLRTSERTLNQLGQIAQANASRCALGEYYALLGNRSTGVRLMRSACRRFRNHGSSPRQSWRMFMDGTGSKHPVYEMNSIVRLAFHSVWWRYVYAPRGMYMGVRHRTNNRAKLIELALLLVGGTRLVASVRRRRLARAQNTP